MTIETKFFTVAEVAGYLRCHPQTIRRKIREQKIDALFDGKKFLISESSRREYMNGMSLAVEPK